MATGIPPELEMFDVLGGAPEPYAYFEKFVFDRREHTLRAIAHAVEEGLLVDTIDGNPVSMWQIADWRRNPTLLETEEKLNRLVLSITEAGLKHA